MRAKNKTSKKLNFSHATEIILYGNRTWNSKRKGERTLINWKFRPQALQEDFFFSVKKSHYNNFDILHKLLN